MNEDNVHTILLDPNINQGSGHVFNTVYPFTRTPSGARVILEFYHRHGILLSVSEEKILHFAIKLHELPRSKTYGRKRPVPWYSGDFMEAVFR